MSDCRTRGCHYQGWNVYDGRCYTHRPDAPISSVRYPLPSHRQCSVEGPCLSGVCGVNGCRAPAARVFAGKCWYHFDEAGKSTLDKHRTAQADRIRADVESKNDLFDELRALLSTGAA